MDINHTIHQLFEEQAKLQPDGVAAIHGEKSFSYDTLNQQANQLAHYLLTKNPKSDAPIAFCVERSFECLVVIFAILKVGAAYLPIDASHPKDRLLFILQHSNTSLLITSSHLKEKFDSYQETLILLDHSWPEISTHDIHNPNLEISSKQLAYVIYTSGSTGSPKGVLIEHRSVINYCHWFADYCCMQNQQRIDFSSNHAFDMAVTLTIAPLVLGLGIVICEDEIKKNLREYLQYLNYFQINCIKLTPSFFKILVEEVQNQFIDLPYLQHIILGGENLSSLLCKSWLALYPQHLLHNEYGPTETSVGVSQYTVSPENIDNLGLNVPIGQFGSNMDYLILNSDHTLVPDQEIGELYIGGSCLARGYLNQPELTQKQFIPHPFSKTKNARLYKTGDLGRVRADGILEYFGRIDAQVKIRGFRIEPGEIEKQMKNHEAIKEVVVLAQKDPSTEDRLVAYYTLKDKNNAPNATQLRQYLQKYLPDYMIPSVFMPISAFPLTNNGKLDHSLLPKPQCIASQTYREPVTVLEKRLTAIWSHELDIQNIGLDDDFFELGGHSLSAARIISKINRILGKELSLHAFYHATNIAKLALVIQNTRTKQTTSSTQPHQDSNIPLGDFQFMLWMASLFESKTKKINITFRKCLEGTLDKKILECAFHAVLQKQEALRYRISSFRPVQFLLKNPFFSIMEKDLHLLSEKESNLILEDSIKQLINYSPWPKNSPLIAARLFYLNSNRVELQIALSHSIADDFSPEILFADLSHFYLLYQKQSSIHPTTNPVSYQKYVFSEQDYFHQYLNRDLLFWEKYLQDTGLFTFPEQYIIKNQIAQKMAYSTYTKIPETALVQLKHFCAKHHISVKDGLSAAITLALQQCSPNAQNNISYFYTNIIKSTRNNEVYDKTIGCFLRLEPIKIALDKEATLENLSKQIHQSTIETSPYQQCPGLVKLAAISNFRKKSILSVFTSLFSSIYANLFSFPAMSRKMLMLCSKRLISFKQDNHFLVNINVHRSFFSEIPKNPLQLFGLNTLENNNKPYDLLKIDNVFDVCFLREDEEHSPYLVISANLKPEFRERIAEETIGIIKAL